MAKHIPGPPDSYPVRRSNDGIDTSRNHGTGGNKPWPEVHREYDTWRDSRTGHQVPKPDYADDDCDGW